MAEFINNVICKKLKKKKLNLNRMVFFLIVFFTILKYYYPDCQCLTAVTWLEYC